MTAPSAARTRPELERRPITRLRLIARWVLLAVLAFTLLSAVGGGIAMLATDGLGMPESMLTNGPFTTFVVPALVLLFVVGGTHAVAVVLMLLRREPALLWSAVAAFGVMIWIFVETGIIAGNSWLQVIYFAAGTIELILVLALLGVVGWLPRRPLRTR